MIAITCILAAENGLGVFLRSYLWDHGSWPRWLRKFVPEVLYLGDQFSRGGEGGERDKFVKCRVRYRAIDCDLLRIYPKLCLGLAFTESRSDLDFQTLTSVKRGILLLFSSIILFKLLWALMNSSTLNIQIFCIYNNYIRIYSNIFCAGSYKS